MPVGQMAVVNWQSTKTLKECNSWSIELPVACFIIACRWHEFVTAVFFLTFKIYSYGNSKRRRQSKS